MITKISKRVLIREISILLSAGVIISLFYAFVWAHNEKYNRQISTVDSQISSINRSKDSLGRVLTTLLIDYSARIYRDVKDVFEDVYVLGADSVIVSHGDAIRFSANYPQYHHIEMPLFFSRRYRLYEDGEINPPDTTVLGYVLRFSFVSFTEFKKLLLDKYYREFLPVEGGISVDSVNMSLSYNSYIYSLRLSLPKQIDSLGKVVNGLGYSRSEISDNVWDSDKERAIMSISLCIFFIMYLLRLIIINRSMMKIKNNQLFFKRLLYGYLICLCVSLAGLGYNHSYHEHKDFILSIILPPWAIYRGIESFFHKSTSEGIY